MDINGYWLNIDKNGPIPADAGLGRCWAWLGSRTHGGKGYGQLRYAGRHYGAHVLAMELGSGRPVPAGRRVLHHCDNPACVNPRHLYLGTDKDNARDRHVRKRDRNSVRPESIPRGEESGRARLTDEQVMEMRALYAAGASSYELGGRFGVDPASAWLASTGRTWAHLPMPSTRKGQRTGLLHPRAAAVLDEDAVREIRKRSARGETQSALARAFGIARAGVSAIITRRNWKHVD